MVPLDTRRWCVVEGSGDMLRFVLGIFSETATGACVQSYGVQLRFNLDQNTSWHAEISLYIRISGSKTLLVCLYKPDTSGAAHLFGAQPSQAIKVLITLAFRMCFRYFFGLQGTWLTMVRLIAKYLLRQIEERCIYGYLSVILTALTPAMPLKKHSCADRTKMGNFGCRMVVSCWIWTRKSEQMNVQNSQPDFKAEKKVL